MCTCRTAVKLENVHEAIAAVFRCQTWSSMMTWGGLGPGIPSDPADGHRSHMKPQEQKLLQTLRHTLGLPKESDSLDILSEAVLRLQDSSSQVRFCLELLGQSGTSFPFLCCSRPRKHLLRSASALASLQMDQVPTPCLFQRAPRSSRTCLHMTRWRHAFG